VPNIVANVLVAEKALVTVKPQDAVTKVKKPALEGVFV
jgi:hypothetical protein